MEEDVKKALEEQRELLNRVYDSVEKTRKYFMWTLILSVAFFVVPLIGLLIIIPTVLRTLTSGLAG
ncbi:MAG: hypothetical protein Q8Q38_02065 [bacterium]|nr:hypothetical protein [bacterium]